MQSFTQIPNIIGRSWHIVRASSNRAIVELVLITAVWGMSFIVSMGALQHTSHLWITASRFLLASLINAFFIGILIKKRPEIHKSISKAALSQMLKDSLSTGILLSLTLLFQTWGLKYTTATNSAFLTTLYSLFVPLIGVIAGSIILPRRYFICISSAVIGTSLLCGLLSWESGGGVSIQFSLNRGDLLTIICALTATIQILLVSRFSKKAQSPYLYSVFQCFWAGVFSLICALIIEGTGSAQGLFHRSVMGGLLYLAVFCTLIGFWVQVRVQKVLSASTASMLLLLESPFAAVFAFLVLGESLSTIQWSGALIILASSIAAVAVEGKYQGTKKSNEGTSEV